MDELPASAVDMDAIDRERLRRQTEREQLEFAQRKEVAGQAGLDAAATTLGDYSVCSLPPDAQQVFTAAFWTSVLRVRAIDAVMMAATLKPGQTADALQKESAAHVDLILKDAPDKNIRQVLASIAKHSVSASDVPLDDVRVLTVAQQDAFLNTVTTIAATQNNSHAPRNLLCSESILDWSEVSDSIGRRIANEYIVVQVTVRNLDPDHEFLLHDVQALLNTQRFHATRDRKVVRGVGEIGQLVGPRAVLLNTATALGSATGAATGVLSVQALLGLNIWNAGVVPGLKLVFPDQSVRQLSRLDDMGFSAGASTMVIPKNSAVAMLVFLPQKGFLWHCSEDVNQDHPDMCLVKDVPVTRKLKHNWFVIPTTHQAPKTVRDLSATEMNWLQDRVEVLVAGVHVAPAGDAAAAAKDHPAVTKFVCDAGTYQRMFNNPEAPVQCDVEGTLLNQIGSIRLQSVSDPAQREGTTLTITEGSGNTKAKASFTACELNNLPAEKYVLYADGGAEKAVQGVTWTKTAAPLHPTYSLSADQHVLVKLPDITTDELKLVKTVRLGTATTGVAIGTDGVGFTLPVGTSALDTLADADVGGGRTVHSCLQAVKAN